MNVELETWIHGSEVLKCMRTAAIVPCGTMVLPGYLPIYLSTYLSIYLPICLSIYLSFFSRVRPSIFLSVYITLEICRKKRKLIASAVISSMGGSFSRMMLHEELFWVPGSCELHLLFSSDSSGVSSLSIDSILIGFWGPQEKTQRRWRGAQICPTPKPYIKRKRGPFIGLPNLVVKAGQILRLGHHKRTLLNTRTLPKMRVLTLNPLLQFEFVNLFVSVAICTHILTTTEFTWKHVCCFLSTFFDSSVSVFYTSVFIQQAPGSFKWRCFGSPGSCVRSQAVPRLRQVACDPNWRFTALEKMAQLPDVENPLNYHPSLHLWDSLGTRSPLLHTCVTWHKYEL